MTYVAPLNLFLYTWRFLRELRDDTESKAVKKLYRGVELFTIILLPAAFYTLVPLWAYLNAWYLYYQARLQINTA
jgi:hypothetical protein